jgi:hypothetical protein
MPEHDKMGQSLKKLAFLSLQSAIDNTLQDKVSHFYILSDSDNKQNSVKKITTSHHLRLITQIFSQQGKKEELLTLFENPKIGIDSAVGLGDIEFTRLEIQLLQENLTKNADRIFNQTFSPLEKLLDAKSKEDNVTQIEALSGADDWYVWESLIAAGFALQDTK